MKMLIRFEQGLPEFRKLLRSRRKRATHGERADAAGPSLDCSGCANTFRLQHRLEPIEGDLKQRQFLSRDHCQLCLAFVDAIAEGENEIVNTRPEQEPAAPHRTSRFSLRRKDLRAARADKPGN
jgi:hypothetical protein